MIFKQKNYLESIQVPEVRTFSSDRVLKADELTLYRSLVGQLNWLSTHTLPNIAYDVSSLSKAFKAGTTQDMKKLIKVLKKVKSGAASILLDGLQENSVEWEVFADASFGNVDEGQTQIGYIISLADNGRKRCPIWWKSRKARRVAKSAIEAEALSVGEAIEGVIYFNHIWKEVTGKKLKVTSKD